MIMETLTPESPRSEEFIEQLNAALAEHGCAGDAVTTPIGMPEP